MRCSRRRIRSDTMSAFPTASDFKAGMVWRRWKPRGRRIGLAAVAIVAGCTALPSPDIPKEYLDQSTAATVTVVGRPLVFARERPNFAVHMRDYITLAAAAVNRTGKIDYILI